MFGDPEWMKWSLAGSDDRTAYKGRDKMILMASIAKAQGMKYSAQQGLLDRETNDPISRNPAEIAQKLLGPTAQLDDLESVESIITVIKNRPDYRDLIADAEETLARDNITLPEGDILRIKELAGI